MNSKLLCLLAGITGILLFSSALQPDQPWYSHLVRETSSRLLVYTPDAQGNTLPNFSHVGYQQCNAPIPDIPVVKTIGPAGDGDQQLLIQAAIDEVAARPADVHGWRGAILLQKGAYPIAGTLHVNTSGIVLRGEGDGPEGTRLIATGKGQRSLIELSGKGSMQEIPGHRTAIQDAYVPVGAYSFTVADAKAFAVGDAIIVYRPGTDQWIHDLKMDSITPGKDTKQWTAKEYSFQFERVITAIKGNRISIDQPIVMSMETKYGGGEIYKYQFNGRIANTGVEHIYCESAYAGDTDEDHGWVAVKFNKAEQSWARYVTSRYFGYSCINLGGDARYITVRNCTCLDAKSQITGGRRYSFNNDGQMNLFMDCRATEGRHDYVTGAQVRGPNVFYRCTAEKTHADIGPHHRWAMGTLYDNIVTDGEINIQDRGNWGTGHGWAGVNQVLWHCTAAKVTVQKPWVTGNNYCIGLQGAKIEGRLKGRNDGEWEGQNKPGMQPASLFAAQLFARRQQLY